MDTLGVVHFADGWRLVSRGRRWGRFWARADAEVAAVRLAHTAEAHGGSLRLLSQEPWGEMTELPSSALPDDRPSQPGA
jgi:hypothetical protein